MSESQDGRRFSRRLILEKVADAAEIAAAAAILYWFDKTLPHGNSEMLAGVPGYHIVQVGDGVDLSGNSVKDVDVGARERFVKHLRDLKLIPPEVADREIDAWSIQTFALHQNKDGDRVYPYFAVFPPPKKSPNHWPRIIMQKQQIPVELIPSEFTTAKGQKIVSWATALAHYDTSANMTAEQAQSPDVVLQQYIRDVDSSGQLVISKISRDIYYFPQVTALNTNFYQALSKQEIKRMSEKGMPMSMADLPAKTQALFTNGILLAK